MTGAPDAGATPRPVLLTRPEADSAALARALAAEGVPALVWPLTRIVPAAGPVLLPPGTEALVFTSGNAVEAFAAASAERALPVLAVGDRTAALAREAGFVEVASAGGDVADLARLARASGHRRLFHPRGCEAAGDLAGALEADGIALEAAVLYAAEPGGPPRPEVAAALASGGIGLVTIWSPRAGAILAGRLTAMAPALGGTDLLGISANAVAPLGAAGFRSIVVADRPDGPTMRAAIVAALRHESGREPLC